MSAPKNVFEIFQLLEKSNCGNCGEKTCLAFAGAVFKGHRRLSDCPRLSPGVAARFSHCHPARQEMVLMAADSSALEKIYRDYLAQLAAFDWQTAAEVLGGQADGKGLIMPFFGRPYTVSDAGISDPSGGRPSHSVSVLLSKYLLMCPKNSPLDASWVSYKDFRDAGPFAGGFRNNAEVPLERAFGSNPGELGKRCEALGGVPAAEDFPYEVAMRLPVLPKIPILLLFNGTDNEFPARCAMLFERRAENYLDMECLAIAGWALSAFLLETPRWGSL